jgi:F-type H+-transporting ATPase subunit alpha
VSELRYTEVGYVKSIRGCIVVVGGLKHCINGQLVHFGFGTIGTILGFNEEEASVLILKLATEIKTGEEVHASLEPFNVPVGNNFIGRIVNPLCEPFDGLGDIKADASYPIFPAAPAILERQPLCKTLETGTKVLDSMIPIGLGQRQLILGNKMTGKTTFVTDAILNQKHTGVICIYCAIGKARSQLARVVQLFQDHDAFKYTIIVAAPSSSPPGQQYLAPYVACSLGEYFMQRGGHVFVGFDDFTKHAWCYREISLLLGRPPGRDSYPGDIFYLHSKMIERACYLDAAHGAGSMTFIPIVEILEGDLTAFVPSNLVSMTDGQIMLDAAMFGEGQKPALDLGLSVSRVGTKVQWPIVKNLAGPLRLEFLQFRELQRLSKLRSGEQSEDVVLRLRSGEILTQLLKQDKNHPVIMEGLVLILYAYHKKYLHKLTKPEIDQFQAEIYEYAKKENADFIKLLRERRKMDEEIEEGLNTVISTYIEQVEAKRPIKEETKEEDIMTNIGRDVLDEATSKKK